jgi:hypothetical protein
MEITNIVSASRPNLNSTLYETARLAPGFSLCFDLQRAARVLTWRFDERIALALALALGTGQRTVWLALDSLATAGKIQSFGHSELVGG